VQLPEIPIAWGAAEFYAALAVLALLVIKILFHVDNFGWGFYAVLVLAAAMTYGAFGISRATAAPSHVPAHGG